MVGERGAAPSIGRHGRCCSDEEKLLLQDVLLPSYPHLGLSEEVKQWDSHVMKGCKGDMSIDCLRFFFDRRSFSYDADDRIP